MKKKEKLIRIGTEDFLEHINKDSEVQVNAYQLCRAVAKRAKQLTEEKQRQLQEGNIPATVLFRNFNAVSQAAKEIYTGKVKIM